MKNEKQGDQMSWAEKLMWNIFVFYIEFKEKSLKSLVKEKGTIRLVFNKIIDYNMENSDLECKPEAKISSERILIQHINHS